MDWSRIGPRAERAVRSAAARRVSCAIGAELDCTPFNRGGKWGGTLRLAATSTLAFAGCLFVGTFWSANASAQSTPITTIANPGFEIGTSGTTVSTGWTQISGLSQMYISNGTGLSAGSPPTPQSGSLFLTADRFANPADTNGTNNRGVFQNVDLTPYASIINLGGRQMELSFAYNDNDANDTAVTSYNFFDGVGAPIGNTYTFTAGSAGTGNWATTSLVGEIPVGASAMHLELRTTFNNVGTVRNVSYDSLSANILPPAPPSPPSGLVNGNLIQFDSEGAWTWYTDERAIVDPNNGHMLVNSVGYSPTVGGGSPGNVDVVDFNPLTGRRVRTRLSNQVPGNPQIQNDDHNVGALLVLPDGRYLAMYANHGNNGGLGDEFSRWRRSINPGDSTSWTTEQLFNWFNAVPGANQTGNPEAANVSYHNLFYLSAENQVYDISRSYGRLSINGASQNMPNIMRYDMATNTVDWAGQLLESQAQGYSAYPKYASNGVDRIYFTTHRDPSPQLQQQHLFRLHPERPDVRHAGKRDRREHLRQWNGRRGLGFCARRHRLHARAAGGPLGRRDTTDCGRST